MPLWLAAASGMSIAHLGKVCGCTGSLNAEGIFAAQNIPCSPLLAQPLVIPFSSLTLPPLVICGQAARFPKHFLNAGLRLQLWNVSAPVTWPSLTVMSFHGGRRENKPSVDILPECLLAI